MAGIPLSFGNSQPVQPGIGAGPPIRQARVVIGPGQQSASAAGAAGAPATGRDSANVKPGLPGATARIASLERAAHQAATTVDELDRVDDLITELQSLIGGAHRSGDASAIADIQGRIDQIIGTISNAESSIASVRQPVQAQLPVGYTLVRNEVITTRASGFYSNDPGASADLSITITSAAQQAGFLLSFGAGNLNLGGSGASDGAAERFVVELTGNTGARKLSFASGTALSDIRDAINSFTESTGIRASASETGLFIKSDGYGIDEYVTVRTLETGGVNRAHSSAGVYRLEQHDDSLVRRNSLVTFEQSLNGTSGHGDHGENFIASVNGQTVEGRGLNLSVSASNWRINADITAAFASRQQPPTLLASFQSLPRSEGERPSNAGPAGAEQEARGFVETLSESLATVRARATDHLATARQQVRDALENIPSANPHQSALDTLAAYRKSLLGE